MADTDTLKDTNSNKTNNMVEQNNINEQTDNSNNNVTNNALPTDTEMQQKYERYKKLLEELDKLEYDQVEVYNRLKQTNTSQLTKDINEFFGLNEKKLTEKLTEKEALLIACILACAIKKYELMVTTLNSVNKDIAMLVIYAYWMQAANVYTESNRILLDDLNYLQNCFDKFETFVHKNQDFVTKNYVPSGNSKTSELQERAKETKCDITSFSSNNKNNQISKDGIVMEPRALVPNIKFIDSFYIGGFGFLLQTITFDKSIGNDLIDYFLAKSKIEQFSKQKSIYHDETIKVSTFTSLKTIINKETEAKLMDLPLPFPGHKETRRVSSILVGCISGGLLAGGMIIALAFFYPLVAATVWYACGVISGGVLGGGAAALKKESTKTALHYDNKNSLFFNEEQLLQKYNNDTTNNGISSAKSQC